MNFRFEILNPSEINSIIPMVQKLSGFKVSEAVLKARFADMVRQNYECAVVYDEDALIGVSGLWFSTRHYSGKSVEVDHVYIEEAYRNIGLGKEFMAWIYEYGKLKGCEAVELNTYVQNHASHKFYHNEGFQALAYHFLKRF